MNRLHLRNLLISFAKDLANFTDFKFHASLNRKMKMYEEQELTMQVFSEPEILTNECDVIVSQIFGVKQFLSNSQFNR